MKILFRMWKKHFIHWDDDAEMMNQLVINFLTQTIQCKFCRDTQQGKMGVCQKPVANRTGKKEVCLELIKPKLKKLGCRTYSCA